MGQVYPQADPSGRPQPLEAVEEHMRGRINNGSLWATEIVIPLSEQGRRVGKSELHSQRVRPGRIGIAPLLLGDPVEGCLGSAGTNAAE